MQYTKKQIEMLERCSTGLVWVWHRDERGDEILRFLMGEGLITPREDIQCGLLTLTQWGEAVLESENERQQKEKQQAATQRQQENNAVKAEKNVAKEFGKDLFVAGFPQMLTYGVEFLRGAIKLAQEFIRSLGG